MVIRLVFLTIKNRLYLITQPFLTACSEASLLHKLSAHYILDPIAASTPMKCKFVHLLGLSIQSQKISLKWIYKLIKVLLLTKHKICTQPNVKFNFPRWRTPMWHRMRAFSGWLFSLHPLPLYLFLWSTTTMQSHQLGLLKDVQKDSCSRCWC